MHSPSPRSTDTDDEIRSLYDALDERDRYITSLEREIDRHASKANTDLEICNDERIQCNDKILKLQIQLKQLRGDNDDLLEEKTQLKSQVKSLLDQKSSHNSKEHLMHLQRDMHRLELENQRLRGSVIELEQNEDILVQEIDTLVAEKSKFQATSEDLSAKIDSLSSEKDEKSRSLVGMKQDNNNLQTKLDASNKFLKEWQEKETAALQQISKLETELKDVKSKAHHVELAAVKEEMECLRAFHDLCVTDKHAAERDLDHAIQALAQAKTNEKEAIAAAVRKERAEAVKAQLTIVGLHEKESKLEQKCEDLEGKLESSQQKIDRANEKNILYEKGHGLDDAIRYSTKLEADIRRREFDIKQLKQKYVKQKDRCLVLTKACDILKEKANLGPDYSFDDEEINTALMCEENALKGENVELSRQLQCLEGERNDLLSQLRQRAVQIGEKGVKFLGMESTQLAQVIEFATNLRQGIVELPLNDRSADLLTQLSSIKAEREVDKIKIETLERELFALSETRKDPIDDGEKKVLMHSLEALKVEMKALKGDGSSALSPMMRSRAKEIIGEDLVLMPAAAEVQFMCLMKEYECVVQKRINEEHNPFLELNSAHLLDPSSDTPNKELFRQLLLSGQENRELKNRLRHSEADAKASRALLEKERFRFVPGDADNGFGVGSDISDDFNRVHLEMKQMMIALESNLEPLDGYSRDLDRLRKAVVDASRLTTQLSALQNVVQNKNKIIRDMKHKMARAKQANQTLTRELSLGRDVDTSTSSNSLDRSIRRASEGILSSSGSSLGDAAKLLYDKDKIISSLRSKLVEAEKSQGSLLQEAEKMKADIQTLVARLEEAEGVACEIEVYKSSCVELQNAIDDGKKEVTSLKEKLRKVSKASKDNEANIEELTESLVRAKRVLSVQRQGRSRSEHNLKTSTETIASLHQQIEKLEAQAAAARDEKLKANKKVRRLSSMLQSTNDNKLNEAAVKSAEESRTAEEMQQRIDVQDKTIAGLASQNSKLRSELARAKMAIKDADKEGDCTRCNDFESKMKQLDRSLSKEKKDLSTTRSKLERCKKKSLSLEQQISDLRVEIENREATNGGADDSLQAEISSLREKNESLLLAMKDNNFDALKQLRAENFQLKKENERLLRVDHLGLFEEIEEMKIRYNEAVRQLNQRHP
uniref:Uncharacterized protein n=1 Tax=Skeletonema marinoi TaxID=267567 RepID=A0A7S2VHY6_9STRA|mmetsp:Transcript_924/g.1507  ORF Transcript_924/g.1507 Transcript_924/m.1507 type:complete len:1168 (+) Transcript_924:103-3606(+)